MTPKNMKNWYVGDYMNKALQLEHLLASTKDIKCDEIGIPYGYAIMKVFSLQEFYYYLRWDGAISKFSDKSTAILAARTDYDKQGWK